MSARKQNRKVAGLRYWPTNLTKTEIARRVYRPRPVPAAAAAAPPPILTARLQTILDDVICMIRLPVEAPLLFAPNGIRPERGVLLHGLPGTGKTTIARAVREECNRTAERIAFLCVSGPELLQGDVTENVEDLFTAAKSVAPTVVFFDEIDSLFLERGASSVGVMTLLPLIDGIDLDVDGRVFLMAATNDRRSIEGALVRPGRFDTAIELHLPTPAERLFYLQAFTQNWTVNAVTFATVVDKARSFSPSDLAALCRKAALTSLKRNNVTMRGHPSFWVLPFAAAITLIQTDFTTAFATVKASGHR